MYQIDSICKQEHRYYHFELDLKYHDTSKGWTFVLASARKNSVNVTIGGIGIVLYPCDLKSLNDIEKKTNRELSVLHLVSTPTQQLSLASDTSDETDITTFYNKISFLTRHIPKHNVLILSRDMNAQIGKKCKKKKKKKRIGLKTC